MYNSMLFKELREFTTGLLNQLLVNLAGEDGQSWLDEFKKFLRREPCWVGPYLRRVWKFTLGAIDGKDVPPKRLNGWEGFCTGMGLNFSPDFEKFGIIFSGIAPETEIVGDDLIKNCLFGEFLGKMPSDIEKKRLLGSQLLAICRDSQKKINALRKRGFFGREFPSTISPEDLPKLHLGGPNYVILTRGDEPVADDLSNVFLANVVMSQLQFNELGAHIGKLDLSQAWHGCVNKPRVFYSQQ